MHIRQNTTRGVALFAAILVTTLMLGSQLGLAERYVQQADVVMAAKRATQIQAATAPAKAKPAT